MKKVLILLTLFSMLLCLCACGHSHSISMEAEFGILCTNFPAYDFARSIAGDRFEIELLVPPGGDSHSFEPTAQDIIKMQNWLVICNGGENDVWVDELLENDDLKLNPIRMMDCVDVYLEESKEGMQATPHAHEHDESCEHDHGEEMEYDEHVWTSPLNALEICEAICARLCEISPEDELYFKANFESCSAKLLELDEEAQHVHRFLVEQPRHAVGGRAVQAAVRGHETKRAPALVDVGRSRRFEAADIMTPEAEAAGRERKAGAQGFCHGNVGGRIVAAQ